LGHTQSVGREVPQMSQPIKMKIVTIIDYSEFYYLHYQLIKQIYDCRFNSTAWRRRRRYLFGSNNDSNNSTL